MYYDKWINKDTRNTLNLTPNYSPRINTTVYPSSQVQRIKARSVARAVITVVDIARERTPAFTSWESLRGTSDRADTAQTLHIHRHYTSRHIGALHSDNNEAVVTSRCRVVTSLLPSASFVILNVITAAVSNLCVSTIHPRVHPRPRARLLRAIGRPIRLESSESLTAKFSGLGQADLSVDRTDWPSSSLYCIEQDFVQSSKTLLCPYLKREFTRFKWMDSSRLHSSTHRVLTHWERGI